MISIYEDFNPVTSDKAWLKQTRQLDLEQIYEVIKNGYGHGINNISNDINFIRNNDKKTGQRTKEHLPSFTVAAYFTGLKKGVNEPHIYNDLMILDIDGLLPREVQAKKQILIDSQLFSLVFISPSGNGLKAVLPLLNSTSKKHNRVFNLVKFWIKERFNLDLDKSGSDLSRLCYFSYDPNVFFDKDCGNINVDNLETKYGQQLLNSSEFESGTSIDESKVDATTANTIFNSVITELKNNGSEFVKGNRHYWLLDLLRLKKYGLNSEDVIKLLLKYDPVIDFINQNPKEIIKIPATIREVFKKYYKHYDTIQLPIVAPVIAPVIDTISAPVAAKKTGYLAEYLTQIQAQLEQQKTLFLDAPTGMGKTSLIRLLAKRMNMKVDLLMPTRALVEQQDKGKVIDGQGSIATIIGSKQLKDNHLQADVLAACYPAIKKLRSRKARILAIDEAHGLASDYGYKADVIQTIINHLPRYDYVIYLSGSMFPLNPLLNTNNYLRFTNPNQFNYTYKLITLAKPVEGIDTCITTPIKERDYFISNIKSDRLNVLYLNDKAELKKIQKTLQNKGLKVLLFSKDEIDDNNYDFKQAYTKLIDEQLLIDVDVVLTTCLIQAGVNINNSYDNNTFNTKKGVEITFSKSANVIDIIQFTARFRKCNPSIVIIHDQKIGKMRSYNVVKAREDIVARIKGYMETDKAFANCSANEIKRKRINNLRDGATFDLHENYIIDEYYIMNKQLETLIYNTQHNITELKRVLANYNFVDDDDPRTYIGTMDEVDNNYFGKVGSDIKKEKKSVVDRIVKELLNYESVIVNENDVLRKTYYKRFELLQKYVTTDKIKSDKLLYDLQYKQFRRSLAFQNIESDIAEQLETAADVRLENTYFNKLKSLIEVDKTYSFGELKLLVTKVPELKYSVGKYLTPLKVLFKLTRIYKRVDKKKIAIGYSLIQLTENDFTKPIMKFEDSITDDFFKDFD